MAQAARTYRNVAGSAAPAYAPSRPRVTVTPGRRSENKTTGGNLLFIFAVIGVVMIVMALLSVVRVGLYSATVQVGLSTQQIEESLEQARSVGVTLEVQQTALSGSNRIKAAAQGLNMKAPDEVVALILPADAMVTDAAGNLSLAGSIGVALSGK